jgi:hypothetical protein
MWKVILVICLALAISAAWYGESRRFFCLSNGQCLTVWKTYNDVCYIIPGKYYGALRPANGYMRCSNTNLITFFFSSELPGEIVFQTGNEVNVHNDSLNPIKFYDFSVDTSRYLKLLYLPTAKTSRDMKPDAELMDLDIRENYATNKDGGHL